MFDPKDIDDIEAQLAEKKVPLSALYEEAGINQSTWSRWRTGNYHPSYSKGKAVEAALSVLLNAETSEGATP